MKSQVFINLFVSDLDKSAAMYTAMGFSVNPAFSDESAKCMVWSEEIFLMLMTKDRFQSFATKPLGETKEKLCGIYALSVASVDRVHEVVDAGLKAGGVESKPLQDHGFMQLRTIEDLDGHTWEIFFMDTSKFPQG